MSKLSYCKSTNKTLSYTWRTHSFRHTPDCSPVPYTWTTLLHECTYTFCHTADCLSSVSSTYTVLPHTCPYSFRHTPDCPLYLPLIQLCHVPFVIHVTVLRLFYLYNTDTYLLICMLYIHLTALHPFSLCNITINLTIPCLLLLM